MEMLGKENAPFWYDEKTECVEWFAVIMETTRHVSSPLRICGISLEATVCRSKDLQHLLMVSLFGEHQMPL